MPWNIVISLLIFWIYLLVSNRVARGEVVKIYWNTTNPMFYTSSQANQIDINLGDSIDIICPRYPAGTSSDEYEYYVIYKVNETEYNSCIINNTSKFKMLINCTYPNSTADLRYTLLIKEFQSIPGNPDFQPGQKYFFITTSGGAQHELDNQYLGACYYKNMKIVLNVCCGSNTTTTTTAASNTTTHSSYSTTQASTTKPTSKSSTSTTASTTTTSATTSTTSSSSNTDSNTGSGNTPGDNVINVGDGTKNTGIIIDSAGHRTILNVLVLLLCVCVAHMVR